MVNYICDKCSKTFKQKGNYTRHLQRKTPCNNIKEKLVDGMVQGKLQDLVESGDIEIKNANMGDRIKVAAIFAGCGGLDYAFHKKEDVYEVVYANDFDKDACDTYETYFNFKPECEDIIKIKNIPDCDILTGGFPCQGFSIANVNRNEKDSRNVLYLELVRLLKIKQPKYFLFENVKGIMSLGGYNDKKDKKDKKGKVFKGIISDLEKCGYEVHTKLFKLKYYDIPQNRERVIFIGIRDDISEKIKFKWPSEKMEITKTLKDAIGDLPIEYDESIQHVGTKHKVIVTGKMGSRKLYWDKIAPTITGRGGGTGGPVINIHPSEKRRMTVREYARIQTFPDDFIFSGCISSMYRQIGNAVPPKFSFILADLIESLDHQL